MTSPPVKRSKDATWSFRSVGVFVPKATAKAREAHGLHAAEIIVNWPAIVGPQLAAYTSPRRIRWPKTPGLTSEPIPAPVVRGGKVMRPTTAGSKILGPKTVLEIWVSGGRAHEIPYLKGPILSRINAYFGYRAITDLAPVDGPVARPRTPAPRRPPAEAEVAAAAQVHALSTETPLGLALAKLGANVKRGRQER
jgi:hypothetical protein